MMYCRKVDVLGINISVPLWVQPVLFSSGTTEPGNLELRLHAVLTLFSSPAFYISKDQR